MRPAVDDDRPLIVHVVHRFDTGGLENGVVNLVNTLPAFRHQIVAMTEVTEFASRVSADSTGVLALHKRAGKDVKAYLRLYGLLRRMRPAVVHTRNIGTLDCALVAWLAGVPKRIHSEHGWDLHDDQGSSARYRLLRRLINPFVSHYVALSGELEDWLNRDVRIPAGKITRVCNGVDTLRFCARGSADSNGSITVGTVTRLSEIKDPLNTVRGFIEANRRWRSDAAFPEVTNLKFVVIGDGPLHAAVQSEIDAAGMTDDIRLLGNQEDVAGCLQGLDIFVLGSRREGISNTILEAMASGLPVVATNTGGNPELVDDGRTGRLVPVGSPTAIADAVLEYAGSAQARRQHGSAGRSRAVQEFSLDAMCAAYAALYEVDAETAATP